MKTKLAINGFGRIGRNILRACIEGKRRDVEIVAINDLAPLQTNLMLFKYDSVHGKFNGKITADKKHLIINGKKIAVFSEKDPKKLPWKKLKVDVALECTGLFTDKKSASAHIKAGAKQVLISAPASDADLMVVYGVNHQQLDKLKSKKGLVVSNASCTTNCLAPVAKAINDSIGIENGLMTTIHSYTADQRLLDTAHSDPRRARSAALSMIPTSTGAAKAVGKVLPELNGKLDGFAMRVPTPNVSVVDLTFTPSKPTTIKALNQLVKKAAHNSKVLDYCEEEIVSVDMNHNPASSIFDATQTRILPDGKLVKILAWYDNEWGFSNRMLDTARYMAK